MVLGHSKAIYSNKATKLHQKSAFCWRAYFFYLTSILPVNWHVYKEERHLFREDLRSFNTTDPQRNLFPGDFFVVFLNVTSGYFYIRLLKLGLFNLTSPSLSFLAFS